MSTRIWVLWVGFVWVGCTAEPKDGTPETVDSGVVEDSGDGGDSADSGEPPVSREVAPGIHRLDGLDLDLPVDDLAPLEGMLGDAQVVALGESIHFSGGYHEVRARMIPYMVETMGMRVVAFEGPWGAAEGSRPYVERCEGELRDAMVGLYFSVWQSPQTAHTLEWLCDWNTAHPDDPVSFFGFDIQQPWHDGPWLRRWLADVHPEPEELLAGLEPCVAGGVDTEAAFWASDDGLAYAAGSVPIPGLSERTGACVEGLGAVGAWLDDHEAEAAAARSADDVTLARVALVAIEAAHVEFAVGTADVAGWDARDAGMADVFELLWQERAGGQRAVIWAHNAHIVANGEDLRGSVYPAGWVDMGSILGDRLGENYAPIGFIASEVAWSWPGMEGTGSARDGALERVLEELGEPWLLVDLPVASADGSVISPGEAYQAGHPARATFVPADHYRGLVYLQSSPEMEFWR